MTRTARALGGWLRAGAERRVHLVVRARSGGDGFALFGGHRPRHHFSRVYLGTRDHRVRLRVHGPIATQACRTLLRDYGLIVFCGTTTPSALAPDVLHLPGMVELTMPVPALDGSRAHWSRSAQNDIARVRNRFHCDVPQGDAWVGEFQRRFYEPSIAQRYGAEAYTASERNLRQTAHAQGTEFLRITRNGVWVGGVLNRSTTDSYRLQRLGWLDGDERLRTAGVVAAMYWFSIRRAAELGHDRVHLGPASPYLEDGLVFFKGKWGAELEPLSCTYGEFRLLVDPSHDTCRRFLATHSLVAYGSNGDVIVFSGRRPADVHVPPTVLAGVRRWYRWRAHPAGGGGAVTHAEVPARLRPWLVEEELPAIPTPTPSRLAATTRG